MCCSILQLANGLINTLLPLAALSIVTHAITVVEELCEDVKVIGRQLASAFANVRGVAGWNCPSCVFVIAQKHLPRKEHLLISCHVQATALNALICLLFVKSRRDIHFPAICILTHRLEHTPPSIAFLCKARNLFVAS